MVTPSASRFARIAKDYHFGSMADEAPKVYGTRWQVIRELGKGGQGIVYEVADLHGGLFGDAAAAQYGRALQDFNRVYGNREEQLKAAREMVRLTAAIAKSDAVPRGALKELLPIDQAVNARTALERMKSELDVLQSTKHPALIRVLDSRIEDRWFVAEFFADGTLGDQPTLYKGDVVGSLRAIRPVMAAVAALHHGGVVHRDIKPANIFIADRGLVLGDCGLAIRVGNQDRLTRTFENVGTRDYMPVWAYSMRLEDVKPNFDVYSLGKVLWSMISGKPHFPIWRFDEPPHDLRTMFQYNSDIPYVHELLGKTVVSRELECQFGDATQLGDEVDRIIALLEARSQFPTRIRPMMCRFCGNGEYQERSGLTNQNFEDPKDRIHQYVCGRCGHIESFFWRRDQRPPGWLD